MCTVYYVFLMFINVCCILRIFGHKIPLFPGHEVHKYIFVHAAGAHRLGRTLRYRSVNYVLLIDDAVFAMDLLCIHDTLSSAPHVD